MKRVRVLFEDGSPDKTFGERHGDPFPLAEFVFIASERNLANARFDLVAKCVPGAPDEPQFEKDAEDEIAASDFTTDNNVNTGKSIEKNSEDGEPETPSAF